MMGRCDDDFEREGADDERDDPQSIDMDEDDDELATAECPHCGAELADGAAYCPHCEQWMTPTLGGPRKWVVVVAIALLATVAIFWIMRR